MGKAPPRRTPEETLKANQAVDKLVADGSSIEAAVKKMFVARSVYNRYKNKKGGVTGSMSVSMLPPRPLGNGKGKGAKRMVKMNDVGSVAHRISVLDRKIASVAGLQDERRKLADHLMGMLKAS
jgi:hypothetical protein